MLSCSPSRTSTSKHPASCGSSSAHWPWIADGEDGLHAYFVHSYHLAVANPATLIATADYGQAVSAIVGRDNFFGTQSHPERSQTLGLALIGNFLRWSP